MSVRERSEDAPSESEAEFDKYLDGPRKMEEGVRCGACKARHRTPDDVRWCYDVKRYFEGQAAAEADAEAAEEVAFARSREAQAERGSWFGPVTEADSWGEDL